MSYEKEIKDTTIRLTIKAITDVLREYKIEPQDVDKAIELGYNQGIDDAIKAVQLFLKVVEQKEPELSE